jgi:MFS family permease
MVGACFVLGPLLLTVTGTAGVAPLVVAAVLLTTGLLCLVGLAELPAPPGDAAAGAFRRLQRERPVLLLAALIAGTLESGPTTFLPVEALADGLSGRAAAALVAVLGVGGLVVQFPLGWLADSYPTQRLLRICAWLALSAALLLLFNTQIPAVLWTAAFLWGAAGAGIYTLAMVDVGRAYAGVALVGATAALVFAYAIGAAISPALVGLVMIWWPQTGFAALMSVVAVVGLCVIPGTSPAPHSSPPTLPVE